MIIVLFEQILSNVLEHAKQELMRAEYLSMIQNTRVLCRVVVLFLNFLFNIATV